MDVLKRKGHLLTGGGVAEPRQRNPLPINHNRNTHTDTRLFSTPTSTPLLFSPETYAVMGSIGIPIKLLNEAQVRFPLVDLLL